MLNTQLALLRGVNKDYKLMHTKVSLGRVVSTSPASADDLCTI